MPETLFETGDTRTVPVASYHDKLKDAKRLIVIRAIEEAQGNYTEAAKRLGLHPTNLHRLIRTLDLKATIGKAKG